MCLNAFQLTVNADCIASELQNVSKLVYMLRGMLKAEEGQFQQFL